MRSRPPSLSAASDRRPAHSEEKYTFFNRALKKREINEIVFSLIQAYGAPAIAQAQRKGTIRAFGVRNWMPQRILTAQTYARASGQPGIAAIVTMELSLPRSTTPLWPGYVPFDADIRRLVIEQGWRCSRISMTSRSARTCSATLALNRPGGRNGSSDGDTQQTTTSSGGSTRSRKRAERRPVKSMLLTR